MDWLHVAATLIDWKSRSLLPRDPAVEPSQDLIREAVIRQLLARRKQLAQELARRRAEEENRFSRPGETTELEATESALAYASIDSPGFLTVCI
jgi:chromatin segregation and condensation protein Rec8/ScpA/Scc1 (kleisin family)